MKSLPGNFSSPSNPIRKIAGWIVTLAVIGMTLMFSVVVFAVILVVGTIGLVVLWWKTRELRRQMRDFQARAATMQSNVAEGEIISGEVIEGEAIRVDEPVIER